MSRLSEIRVVENELPPFRIRKIHGSWCLQHREYHAVEQGGEQKTFLLWAFISAHTSQAEAMWKLDNLAHYDPAHHHMEACS